MGNIDNSGEKSKFNIPGFDKYIRAILPQKKDLLEMLENGEFFNEDIEKLLLQYKGSGYEEIISKFSETSLNFEDDNVFILDEDYHIINGNKEFDEFFRKIKNKDDFLKYFKNGYNYFQYNKKWYKFTKKEIPTSSGNKFYKICFVEIDSLSIIEKSTDPKFLIHEGKIRLMNKSLKNFFGLGENFKESDFNLFQYIIEEEEKIFFKNNLFKSPGEVDYEQNFKVVKLKIGNLIKHVKISCSYSEYSKVRVFTLNDITNEILYTNFVNEMPTPDIILTADNRIFGFNKKFGNLLSLNANEGIKNKNKYIGKDPIRFLAGKQNLYYSSGEESKKIDGSNIKEAFQEGNTLIIDGKYFQIGLNEIDGYKIFTLSDTTKINEKKNKIEELHNKLKQKHKQFQKLIDVLAHDIKSPLASAFSFSSLNKNNIEDLIEYLKTLEKQFKSFILINDPGKLYSELKDIEEIFNPINKSLNNSFDIIEHVRERGKSLFLDDNIIIKKTKFNLLDLFESSKPGFISSLEAKNINLHYDEDQLKNISLYTDQNILTTVVRNLISNSTKFVEKDIGEIYLRSEEINKNNKSFLKFFIKDNGIGIEEDRLDKIFGLGETIKGTQQEIGTGLGLNMCSNFIEQLGGEIGVESEGLGKGSTFWFTIPIDDENGK